MVDKKVFEEFMSENIEFPNVTISYGAYIRVDVMQHPDTGFWHVAIKALSKPELTYSLRDGDINHVKLFIEKSINSYCQDNHLVYSKNKIRSDLAAGLWSSQPFKFYVGVQDDATNFYKMQKALLEKYPVLAKPVVCPDTCVQDFKRDVLDTIIHLNDSHGWSRERIAGWVDNVDSV